MQKPAAQDVFAIAIEVQHLVESKGFRPLPLSDAEVQLTAHSRGTLARHMLSLGDVLAMFPRAVSLWPHEGILMVSTPGSPWLGPFKDPPPAHGQVHPRAPTETQGLQGILRGKAVDMIERLVVLPTLQACLREIALLLVQAPDKTRLVSELGSLAGPETRAFLKTSKLRATQLLRCFANDFQIEDRGPASLVTYLHPVVLPVFESSKQGEAPACALLALEPDGPSFELARLLKLAADVTTPYPTAKGIFAQDLEVLLQTGSCVLIDCRTEAERLVSILPDAVALDSRIAVDIQAVGTVVTYCCIGCRSAKLCEELPCSLNRLYLIGGVAAWAHQSGRFVDPATGSVTRRVNCWTWELAQFFPSQGYDLDAGSCSSLPRLELCDEPEASLSRASELRLQRLQNIAWEVRLRYFPAILCFEVDDVLRSFRNEDAANYLLIDCRTDPERDVSTIRWTGLPVMPQAEFMAHFPVLVRSPLVFITFCTIGGRSGNFAQKLLQDIADKGIPVHPDLQIRSMSGGIAAWLHRGGQLVDFSGGPSRRVHPWVHAFADLFPVEGLELVLADTRSVPNDARPFIDCTGACASSIMAPRKIMRACQVLAPAALADSLDRAAKNAHYED